MEDYIAAKKVEVNPCELIQKNVLCWIEIDMQ